MIISLTICSSNKWRAEMIQFDNTFQDYITNNLCPISSNNNSRDVFFSYPVNVYQTSVVSFENKVMQMRRNGDGLNCSTIDLLSRDRGRPSDNICSQHALCPVHYENVIDSVSRYKRKLQKDDMTENSSFCQLSKSIQSINETINMIIFGGSVTSGAYANGCNRVASDECIFKDYGCKACAWTGFFRQWVSDIFPSNINVVNLGKDGFSTALAVDTAIGKLRSVGISRLSNKDIVFLGL
jgi:hypothetical protein